MKSLVIGVLASLALQAHAGYTHNQAVLNNECDSSKEEFQKDFKICSEYTLGHTSSNNAIGKTTYDACSTISEEHVIESACPMMKELNGQGYSLVETGHDHGLMTEIMLNGNEAVNLDVFNHGMTIGEVHHKKIPEGYEANWADWGTKNSIYEYRYEKMDNGTRRPYAFIYRRSFQATFMNYETGDSLIGQQAGTLVIISIDGMNSKVIGTVDTVKAWKDGQSGNLLARACADSLLKGSKASLPGSNANKAACTSYKAD